MYHLIDWLMNYMSISLYKLLDNSEIFLRHLYFIQLKSEHCEKSALKMYVCSNKI